MKKRIQKILQLDWKYIFVELVLIVAGILLAINLNAWNSNRKLKKQTQASIEKIIEEVKVNVEELEYVIEANKPMHEFFIRFSEYVDEDFTSVECTAEEMQDLRNDFKDHFIVQDSLRMEDGRYRYGLRLQFELEYGELIDIAWQAAKISNAINEYPYECLKEMLMVYDFQKIFTKSQEQFLDYGIFRDEERFIMLFELYYKISQEQLSRYENLMEVMDSCRE
jgi:hypothetical protein